MQIEVTTDEHIDGNAELISQVEADVDAALSRHRDWLTRVEVHLADENGGKGGATDKRCTVEARPKGLAPVAASHHAATTEQASRGALQKLGRVLERQAGQRDGRKGAASIRHLEVDEGGG